MISLKNAFTYRSSVLFSIIGSAFNILVLIALWKYIYSYDTEMMNYMILYVIISNTIGMFYSENMCEQIGGKVANGSFALELIRPVNFIYLGYMRMVGNIIANVSMRGIPVMLLFSPLIISNAGMVRWEMLGLFAVVVILGHFLFTILYALIGFMAFICFEVWTFQRLLRDTIRFLSGSFIPIALFPDWLETLSRYLPFRYLYSLPIEILLGETTNEVFTSIGVMILWILGLLCVMALLYRRAVDAFVVQGG